MNNNKEAWYEKPQIRIIPLVMENYILFGSSETNGDIEDTEDENWIL